MRKTFLIITFSVLQITSSSASNCPTGDAKLKNNTPISTQCPNGFTSNAAKLGSSNIQTAMQSQSNNVQMVSAAAQNDGVPINLALAASYQESRFNSCAGSQTGVLGPMQLTQVTGKSLGYNRSIDQQNIKGGMAVLKQAINACGTSNYACLSAHYNGSNAKQQAQWANGVKNADAKLKNMNNLATLACKGSTCKPSGTTPQTPTPTNNFPTSTQTILT